MIVTCPASDCKYNNHSQSECKLEKINLVVKIGAMAKDQYEVICSNFQNIHDVDGLNFGKPRKKEKHE